MIGAEASTISYKQERDGVACSGRVGIFPWKRNRLHGVAYHKIITIIIIENKVA